MAGAGSIYFETDKQQQKTLGADAIARRIKMLSFSREKIAPILKRIGANDPDLKSVNLCHKRITNKQVLQIADALEGNTHVTEIWLTNNEISDESSCGIARTTSAGAVGYLMSALEGNRTVLEVYLGGNKIGTRGGEEWTGATLYFCSSSTRDLKPSASPPQLRRCATCSGSTR